MKHPLILYFTIIAQLHPVLAVGSSAGRSRVGDIGYACASAFVSNLRGMRLNVMQSMHDSSRISASLARRGPYEVTFEGGWGTSHYLGFPCLALCIVSLLAQELLTQVAYQQAGLIFFTFPFEFVSPSIRFGPA